MLMSEEQFQQIIAAGEAAQAQAERGQPFWSGHRALRDPMRRGVVASLQAKPSGVAKRDAIGHTLP